MALTAVHETARRTIPHAPRMDVIGRRGVAKSLRAAGLTPPAGGRLQAAALTGDLLSNALYYSLIGIGLHTAHAARRRGSLTDRIRGHLRHSESPAPSTTVWRRGLLLGLAAGIGAAVLPPFLGLGRQPGHRGALTHLLTVLWYTLGGLAAAATFQALSHDD